MAHVHERTEATMQDEDGRPAAEDFVIDGHVIDDDVMPTMRCAGKEIPKKKTTTCRYFSYRQRLRLQLRQWSAPEGQRTAVLAALP